MTPRDFLNLMKIALAIIKIFKQLKPKFNGFKEGFEKGARWLYDSLSKQRDVALYKDGPVLRITIYQGMDMGWKTLFFVIGVCTLFIGALFSFVEYEKTGSLLKAALTFVPYLILYYLSKRLAKMSPYIIKE